MPDSLAFLQLAEILILALVFFLFVGIGGSIIAFILYQNKKDKSQSPNPDSTDNLPPVIEPKND